MAHARRKFDQAKDNHPELAAQALTQISKLYKIERFARNQQLSYDEIKQLRQDNAIPILDELKLWLNKNRSHVMPKSAIGKAIEYTFKLWPRLTGYVNEGHFEIDNNKIENTIRPVALGRKNYLFAGSNQAAQYAAMIYSFLGTCKLNGIEPRQWLTHVLTVIPDYKVNQLEELLPAKKD